MMPLSIKIFAGSASKDFGARVATAFGQQLGSLSLRKFSDGELYPVFKESIQNARVVLVQSTQPPAAHIIELLLMIDAAKHAGAHEVIVVAPYLGYMRQDKIQDSGGPLGAKLQANILTAAGADRLITCDPHTEKIAEFFNGPVVQISSDSVFMLHIKALELKHLTLAAPDLGAVNRTRSYAQHLSAAFVACHQQRPAPNEVATLQVMGPVQGADIVLIDDIVDTGNTLCKAAEQLKAHGARSIRAFCTHPVLSGRAHQNLADSAIEELVVTDTIPLQQTSSKIKVLSIAAPIATAIQQLA